MAGTITEMQLVQTAKLVPYVNNARTHSPEQIMKLRSSIREFGFLNPVIIDRSYNLVAGHGRIMAAKEEGIDAVPCVFVDNLTEAQKKALQKLLADLQQRYPKALVLGHCELDWRKPHCPGFKVPSLRGKVPGSISYK